MSRGRPLRCNLDRDGYEEAAERVKEVMRHTCGPHVATIAPCGGVRVVPRFEYSREALDELVQSPIYVGTYNRQVPIENIEADFIYWLQQRHGARAAA